MYLVGCLDKLMGICLGAAALTDLGLDMGEDMFLVHVLDAGSYLWPTVWSVSSRAYF